MPVDEVRRWTQWPPWRPGRCWPVAGLPQPGGVQQPEQPGPDPTAYTTASPVKWLHAHLAGWASTMASSTGSGGLGWPKYKDANARRRDVQFLAAARPVSGQGRDARGVLVAGVAQKRQGGTGPRGCGQALHVRLPGDPGLLQLVGEVGNIQIAAATVAGNPVGAAAGHGDVVGSDGWVMAK